VIAFLPTVLDLFGLAGTTLWRAASAIFCIYLVAFFFSGRSRINALSESDRSILGGPRAVWMVSGGFLANLVLQPLNATGILFEPQPGVLLAGLLLVLLTSITIFVRIVFIRPTS